MNYLHDPIGNPHRPARGTALCHIEDVPPGVIKRFKFGPYDQGFRGFVVQARGGVQGYFDWCPHWGIPLQDDRDDILRQDGLVVCQWHLARFSPVDGKGVDGPTYEGLRPWPVVLGEDGVVRAG